LGFRVDGFSVPALRLKEQAKARFPVLVPKVDRRSQSKPGGIKMKANFFTGLAT
jgi:hypothetical protein